MEVLGLKICLNHASLVFASPFLPTGLGSFEGHLRQLLAFERKVHSLWESRDTTVAACLLKFLDKLRKFPSLPADVVCKMLYV